jgi:hypothetical protein
MHDDTLGTLPARDYVETLLEVIPKIEASTGRMSEAHAMLCTRGVSDEGHITLSVSEVVAFLDAVKPALDEVRDLLNCVQSSLPLSIMQCGLGADQIDDESGHTQAKGHVDCSPK